MKLFVMIAILLFACNTGNDAAVAEMHLRSSFDLRVLSNPRPVVINGKPTLVYELHLTNFASSGLMLKCISVLDASTGEQIMTLCDDALAARLGLTGLDKRKISPGMHAVVYLEVEIPRDSLLEHLKHRIEYEDLKDHVSAVVYGAEIQLNNDALLILDPPVTGGPWAAIYSASWERGHRRVFYAVEGRACLPGRFAMDWIKLDQDGRNAKGDIDQIGNWYGYGADVIAVLDARVAATRDNVEESKTISAHSRHKLEDASGNYVALDLGKGYFAFYEHLKPGSIRVKPGDRVQQGQVIASLGFTGDSTGPHLHFHVANRNSLLSAEGVPYVFRTFTVLGSYSSLDEFGKKPWTPKHKSADSRRNSEFPGSNVVVMFD